MDSQYSTPTQVGRRSTMQRLMRSWKIWIQTTSFSSTSISRLRIWSAKFLGRVFLVKRVLSWPNLNILQMKLYSITNLFEFRDSTFQGTLENLLFNTNSIQGLGLPDMCVVCRRQSTGVFKSAQDQTSAFHFIQGYCATQQAEVSAYIQSLLSNQEKDPNGKLFGSDVIIFKITYVIYDIFSRTFLICQFEQPDEGHTQFKNYGIEANRNHWEGAYVSSVLRAIDINNKMPSIGRFFNNLNICNPVKLLEFIRKLLGQLQNHDNRFQDLNIIKSKSEFPDIHDLVYYLNWPLHILIRYLEGCGQLEVLLKALENIEENIIYHLIKGVVYYKLKQYQNCLLQMAKIPQNKIALNIPKYIQARAFIKLKRFENAFLLLRSLIIESYENSMIWIAMAELFRKKEIYQLSLIFLNKASIYPLRPVSKVTLEQMNLLNYKLLTQNKNLQSPSHMDYFYKLVHPSKVDRVESYAQISGHPVLDSLLVRPRQPMKKDYKTYDQLIKVMMRPEYKVSPSAFDQLVNNELLDCEKYSNIFIRETFKIFQAIGFHKIKSLIASLFYQRPKQVKKIDQIYDPSEFAIQLTTKKNLLQLDLSAISCTNKLMDPKSNDEGDDDGSDDEKPNFLKQNQRLNKSFDFGSNVSIKQYQTPQHRVTKSPIKFQSIKKKNQQLKKTNTIILENQFESMESERQHKKFSKSILNEPVTESYINQGPISGVEAQSQKHRIFSLQLYLNDNIAQQEHAQLVDQLIRRKETIHTTFAAVIEQIVKVLNELDLLFYAPPMDRSQNMSNAQSGLQSNVSPQLSSPIFKSNLKKTLQSRQHIEKQAEFKEFYMVPPQELEDMEIKDKFCQQQLKSEALFLFKCSKLARVYRRNELALQILQRLQNKIISVQISAMLFKFLKNDPKMLIRQIQKALSDFQECGIKQIKNVPVWMEMIIIKMTKVLGANQVLALLNSSESDWTFYLIKRVILQAENLA